MSSIRQLTLALALALCLLAAESVADTTTFRVDSYIPDRFTDLLWRLNGSLDLSGNTTDQTNEPAAGANFGTSDGSGSQQSGGVSSNVSFRQTTIERFLQLSASAGFHGSRSGSSSDSRMQLTESTLGYDTSFSDSRRWAYTGRFTGGVEAGQFLKDDFFAGGRFAGRFYYTAYPTDERTDYRNRERLFGDYVYNEFRDLYSDARRDSREVYSDAALEIGYGRVYDGIYGSHALDMIDALGQEGLLNREPESEEMMQLAEIIYHEREGHNIDDRLGKIVSLERIMSFLTNAGIVRSDGTAGYPYLYDVWDFFPRDARRFGWRVVLAAGYDYRYRRSDRSEEGFQEALSTRYHIDSATVVDTAAFADHETHEHAVTRYEDWAWYGEGRIEYYRPFRRHWQIDALFSVRTYPEYTQIRKTATYRYLPTASVVRSSSSSKRSDWLRWQVHFNLRYIFDQRTSADFGGSVQYSSSAGSVYDPYHDLQVSLYPRVTYRISIPTTLHISMSITHNESNWQNHESSNWSYSLSSSVSHYLY